MIPYPSHKNTWNSDTNGLSELFVIWRCYLALCVDISITHVIVRNKLNKIENKALISASLNTQTSLVMLERMNIAQHRGKISAKEIFCNVEWKRYCVWLIFFYMTLQTQENKLQKDIQTGKPVLYFDQFHLWTWITFVKNLSN